MSIILWYYLVVAFLLGGTIAYIFRHYIQSLPKLVKWFVPGVVLFALILFKVYYINIEGPLRQGDKLNIIGQVSALTFAVFVGFLALLQLAQFSNDKKEQKLKSQRQFINSIQDEVNNAGWWTGLHDKTGGYQPGKEAQFRQDHQALWIDPLISRVHPISCAYIKNASLLLGLSELAYDKSDKKNGLTAFLAGYLLWCETFNYHILDLQRFISSQTTFCISIHDKNKLAANTPDPNQLLMNSLTDEEKKFMHAVADKYEFLHFEIIGNKEKQALFFYHSILLELLTKLEQDVESNLKEFRKYNLSNWLKL